MKKLVKTYTFNAAARQVVISDEDLTDLSQFLLITDVTSNVIIYNFADSSRGGAFSNGTLTLDYNTTAFNNSDVLQIFIDVDEGNRVDLTELLRQGIAEIVHQLQSIRNDGGMADAAGRVRIAIESGSVGISSSQTLANVTTLATLTNIGGQNGTLYLINGANVAAQNLRNKITVT